ncbi:MAG: tRNA (adenosine(37)-N6)-dimethylallyltransferase MiaA [Anaerolineales bacterium]|nr:tRNA (adenosine(37)-N6)-dimethylallyltransferase MiaA [Anaerolineales bacterium]
MAPSERPALIVLIGPTAVGKTELSLRLAERLGGEIVSSDSRLFYRGMDIGTAKPTLADRERVPHHLIDVSNPDQTWSLTVFQKAAEMAIGDILKRGRKPLLVGGTGQYVRAITQGWTPPATAPQIRLREILEERARIEGNEWLHAILGVLDPTAAKAIDPRNLRRSVRALEVIFATGRRFSEQRSQGRSPYRLLMVGLTRPRPELYARIDARIEAMFAAGFLDEVRGLLEQGYSPTLPSFSAIGYPQCAAVLRGAMSLEQAKVEIRRGTRIFVRRQANWFKADDPQIHWFEAEAHSVDKITELARSFLAG